MPYRRLPNTDVARLKALEIADRKGTELPPFKLAFSQKTLNRVKLFVPKFKKAMIQYKVAYSNQVGKSKDYAHDLRKARLYVSHFIQVLNMAIMRGELPPAIRIYYKLSENDKRTPSLNAEEDVIKWGQNIILGETQRINKGMSAISNPNIAMVKVKFEKFMDSYRHQKMLQKTYLRNQQELAVLRAEADDIILNIWNEVENSFAALPDNERRENSETYGLVYVFRRGELKDEAVGETVNMDAGHLP